MSYKTVVSTDGTRKLVENVTGKVVENYYPADSSTGGAHKILTATYTVSAEENGAVFYLNSATEFVTTLPTPFLGAEYTFVVMAAPSGASYTVVTSSSANIVKGVQVTAEVNAAGAADSGTADDTITFVNGQAVAGDMVKVISDGTSWYAYATSKVVAGITFTQAST